MLQGEGITLILDGKTNIKNGITSSTFKTVPDAPISTFELKLPTGPYSILGTDLPASANYSLCGQTLAMPTAITGQNGAVVKQSTKIAVTGCKPAKPTVKVTKTKITGNTVVVTVKTSVKGRVRISGRYLKTTVKQGLNAGTHKIQVAFTSAGKAAQSRHRKTSVRAGLVVGKQTASSTTVVKL